MGRGILRGGRYRLCAEDCQDIKRFNGLEERDFIIWLAELRFERAKTTEAKATVVAELAGLIAMVPSDTEQVYI